MAAGPGLADCVERLLRGFRNYDRAVDVVSAFEMIYTASDTLLPDTVDHFERFPRIPVGDRELTPEFSVLFTDRGGLVGEIARLALPDESVDRCCEQIGRYDRLDHLPDRDELVRAQPVDVLLLVPQTVGHAAIRRILHERLANPEHPYDPSVPPCIVQFGFDEDRYVFQWLPDPANGRPRDGERPERLSRWFEENGGFVVSPHRFREIKTSRSFVNDDADPLYLATHLWAKTFATMAGGAAVRPVPLRVTAADLAETLREQHGTVRAADVRRALELLVTARLAERTGDGCLVAWEELRAPGEHELAHVLATRGCRPPSGGPLKRLEDRAKTADGALGRQASLFDEEA